jgi:hypothetical protein
MAGYEPVDDERRAIEEQWAASWPGPWFLHVVLAGWLVVMVVRFVAGAFQADTAGATLLQAGFAAFCGVGIAAFARLALAKWRVRGG